MYIFGASGHARAIIDILDPKVKISGIFDDNSKIEEILGFPVSGPVPDNFVFDAPLFIAIGNNEGRKFLFEKFSPRTNFGTIVHESALISRYTSIAEGTVVMEGAIVVGDFVHIAPQATLCGGALIGEGTIVGANSTILPGVKVGKWCTIAAGAVISRNLPDGAVQKGYG